MGDKEKKTPEDLLRALCGIADGEQCAAGEVGGTMVVGKAEDILGALVEDMPALLKEYVESEKLMDEFVVWLHELKDEDKVNANFTPHTAVMAHMYTTVVLKSGQEPMRAKLGMEAVKGLMFSSAAYIWWAQNVKGTMPATL